MSLQIIRNDICTMYVDAIVDPTDERFSGIGGTDGMIHRAAGPALRNVCDALSSLRAGEACLTEGFRLPAKYVIHTVGPRWQDGRHGERELFCACYRNSLQLAADKGLKTIAFPLLASGTFGYPKENAVRDAVTTIREFLNDHEMTVFLVVYDKHALSISKTLFDEVEEYITQTAVDKAREEFRKYLKNRFGDFDRDGYDTRVSSFPIESASSERQAVIPKRISGIAVPKSSSLPVSAAKMRENVLDTEKIGLWGDTQGQNSRLKKMLEQKDESFYERLAHMIDERGMTDAQCYNKANIERQLFNKIKNKKDYTPRKATVIALAFALEPTREEFDDLLTRAGYALSNNNIFDIIINYCFETKRFDVIDVNLLLEEFDQPLLGTK